MPSRDHARGTFVLDRRIPGVGRLKVASGTTSTQTFKRLNGMLDTLRAAGRLDILRALNDRVVTPLEVWDRFRTSDLDKLPSAETIKPLWSAWEAWRVKLPEGDHREAIRNTATQLRKRASAEATVGDLPAILDRYRDFCEAKATPRAFNLARSHALSFYRDTVKRSHPLYRAVQDLQKLREARQEGQPFPLAELLAFLPRLAAVEGKVKGRPLPSSPFAAEAARAMAFTGMGPKEYWGRWEVEGDGRLRVYGTKRKARFRLVPLLDPIAKPRVNRKAVEQAMAAASGGARGMYDLRRTFAHLLEEAGVPRARRMMYLGHEAGDVTALYERVEVDFYLREDTEKLRAYLARITEEMDG